LVSFISPLVVVLIIFGLSLIVKSFNRYNKSSVELKRIVQISVSPMISRCSEFIDGVTIIRGYNKRAEFMRKYGEKADIHHNAHVHEECTNFWLRFRVETTVLLVVACTIFTVIFNKKYR
jgi:ABC-type multidrug transport system fused ATPase/permease subunit